VREWTWSWSRDVLDAALLVGEAGEGGEAIVSATTAVVVEHSGSGAGRVVVGEVRLVMVNDDGNGSGDWDDASARLGASARAARVFAETLALRAMKMLSSAGIAPSDLCAPKLVLY
jgi:hypothetical protein